MRPILYAIALLLSLAACRRSDDDASMRTAVTVSVGSPGATEILQAGDVRIVDSDSGVDLALIGDMISGGLSARTLAAARGGLDTAEVSGAGVGASIERIVKSTVGGALGTRVSFPIAAVRDVHYRDGRLDFDWIGKPVAVWGTATVNNRPITFRPADAQRFIDAFHARKRSLGQ